MPDLSPTDNLAEAMLAQQCLTEIVRLAGLAAQSMDNETLHRARESDLNEALTGLCPHRMRRVLIIAALELHEAGWAGDTPPEGSRR